MRTVRSRLLKVVLSLTFTLVTLCGMTPSAQASMTPSAITQPVEVPPLQPTVANDFSDAEFTAADQPELGDKKGGAARLTQEEWILIIGGALLLLIILIIIF